MPLILPYDNFILCDYLIHHNEYGQYANRVIVSDNASIYIENGKLKCNEILLGKRNQKDYLIKD